MWRRKMKFPSAELLFSLHEIEQELKRLGKRGVQEGKFVRNRAARSREMGRAAGLFAAAHMLTDKIKRIGR
jgi:hypothetical protein